MFQKTFPKKKVELSRSYRREWERTAGGRGGGDGKGNIAAQ